MKKYLLKNFLRAVTALAVIMQLVTAVSAEELPVYKRTDAFAKGEQGADGWYFLYERENGEYGEMNKAFSGRDAEGFIKVLALPNKIYYHVNGLDKQGIAVKGSQNEK